jgi:hypothetical protein
VVVAGYAVIAGAIAGPIVLGEAFDPIVYRDSCDVISCGGSFALVHPHSAYRTPNLTIEVHDDRCGSRTRPKSTTVECFVARTGTHDTDLAVWFSRPGLTSAIILLSTGLPLLAFMLVWSIATFIYQALYKSNRNLTRVLGLVILIALGMYGFFGTLWGSILLSQRLKETETAQCRVAHCIGDDLALIETEPPSPHMTDIVQFAGCERHLNKVVNCFSPFTEGSHVTLTRPGFAMAVGILASSLVVVAGFIVGGCYAGLRRLIKSCDEVDQADIAAQSRSLTSSSGSSSSRGNPGKADSVC